MTRRASIPSLAEYLARHVTDGRSEGFDNFQDFAERTLALAETRAMPREAAMVRWLKVMTVAIVETMNAEGARGEAYDQTLACVARALGYLLFDLIYAHADEAAPRAPLVAVLTAEFRAGAKLAASGLEQGDDR